MAKKRFHYEEVIHALQEHVAESEIFSQNGVRIIMRTQVRTAITTFFVVVKEDGDNAFTPFHHIEQALDFAEDKQ